MGLVVVLLPVILLVGGGFAFPEDPVLRSSPYGLIRGYRGVGETLAWRGVPYAAPPVNDLRLRPPQAPATWAGELQALDFKPSCLQPGAPGVAGYPGWNSLNLSAGSEDCLYLNVYAPATTAGNSDALPVMVYFHAGEFLYGSSNDLENDWPYFAKGQVLLVTANVRLGLLGFAALDSLRDRDPSRGSTGNYGMQDQRAVLAWIQVCIAAFGGDPRRVTIFGESSGGTSVAYHLVNKASWGLFHRAILESPGLTQSKPWQHAEENTQFAVAALVAAGSPNCAWPSQAAWLTFPGLMASGTPIATAPDHAAGLSLCLTRQDCFLVSSMGANSTKLLGIGKAGSFGSVGGPGLYNASRRSGSSQTMKVSVRLADSQSATACLVGAAATDLAVLFTSPPHADTFETDSSAPTEDGVELKEALSKLAADPSAVAPGVPLLGGSNMDEGTEFMSLVPSIACNASEQDFKDWTLRQFGPELGPKVPPLYDEVDEPAPVCRDHFLRSSARQAKVRATTRQWLSAMRSAGDAAILCRTRQLLRAGASNAGTGSWWYYFKATPIFSYNFDDMAPMGAFHGAEVPFVFGVPGELKSDGERSLSAAMGCYWRNFAASGNPNEGPDNCVALQQLPQWTQEAGQGTALLLSNSSLAMQTGLKAAQCDLFAKFQANGAPATIVI